MLLKLIYITTKLVVESTITLVKYQPKENKMANKQIASTFDRLLTEVELELMNIIWSLQKVTVKDVLANLAKGRDLAYTTVATVMKVLEQKGFLICQKDSYAHTFSPHVSKAVYKKACIENIVANVFDNEPGDLVTQLLSAGKLRKSDIQSIEDALKKITSSRK